MWINKRERLDRRKLEQIDLTRAAQTANACIAQAERGVRAILSTTEGKSHLLRIGWTSATVGRTSRTSSNATTDGASLLEAVVVSGRISRLLEDSAFVRWAACNFPAALALLHRCAEHRICHKRPPFGP